MRIGLFLLALLLLISPKISIPLKDEDRKSIALLLDNSFSMSLDSRFEKAKELVEKLKEDLGQKYDLSLFTFSEEAKEIPFKDLHAQKAGGSKTNILGTLGKVEGRLVDENLAGVVLISDGGENVAGQEIEIPKIPIFAVGAGDEDSFKDIFIKKVISPKIVYRNEPFEVEAVIKGVGLSQKSFEVILSQDSKAVEVKRLFLKKDSQEMRLSFSITPAKLGSLNYHLRIPALKEEATDENNSFSFKVDVSRSKIRALLIAGHPGWEYSFLRRVLVNDPHLELVSFIILREFSDMVIVPENELSLIPFPANELFTKDLFDFDLLIFENFSYSKIMSDRHLASINEFVNKGGGFLMIGGEDSFGLGGYKKTSLEDILPVTISDKEEWLPGTFKLKIAHPEHPVVRLSQSREETLKIWEEMPLLSGCNFLGRREGAQNLGVRDEAVVLSCWKKGEGRVLALGTNTSWRWSFKMAQEGRSNFYYNLFYKNALRWLIGDEEEERISLSPDKERYETGETIKIKASLFDEYHKPLSGASLKGVLFDKEGNREILEGFKETGQGEYRLDFSLDEPGKYRLRVEAAHRGKIAGHKETSLFVTPPLLEIKSLSPQNKWLETLSRKSGGRYLSLDEALEEEVVKERLLKKARPKYKEIRLTHHFLFFLLMIVFLTSEWYLRRRTGAS
ncbi:hypothetical protein KJ693_03245 [bacterium]|nr:hypothetical protein [bacterium]MBU1614307.1 hypothetical protein [bacterium]